MISSHIHMQMIVAVRASMNEDEVDNDDEEDNNDEMKRPFLCLLEVNKRK